jgi:hypothetical protein
MKVYYYLTYGYITSINDESISVKWRGLLSDYNYSLSEEYLYIIFDKCKKLQKIYKEVYG